FTGEPRECDEGALEWVEINKVEELDLWEGDKIFFRLLRENRPFFSLNCLTMRMVSFWMQYWTVSR
ncbi:mutator MutT protein, partial [human gut metagenome]